MIKRFDKQLQALEVELLWRRISGKVNPEKRTEWDEKAWEGLPIGLITHHEANGDRRPLRSEKEVKSLLLQAVSVPFVREFYSSRIEVDALITGEQQTGADEEL